jgi:hypothetical protein
MSPSVPSEFADPSGSLLVQGGRYSVWRARGSTYARQLGANRAPCICYVEQHLNAATSPDVNYALALISGHASAKTESWAQSYTARVAAEFGIRNGGVVKNPPRGAYNLRFAAAPAMLVEPGFISHPEFAARVQTGEGLDALARCLVESIREAFPQGGIVGLSVGHAYRGKLDPGALVRGEDLDPAFDTEAELNDQIIQLAEGMLLSQGNDSRRTT